VLMLLLQCFLMVDVIVPCMTNPTKYLNISDLLFACHGRGVGKWNGSGGPNLAGPIFKRVARGQIPRLSISFLNRRGKNVF
jgi:hypothetical protein